LFWLAGVKSWSKHPVSAVRSLARVRHARYARACV